MTIQLALLVALSLSGEGPEVRPALPPADHVPEDRGAEPLFRKGVAAYGARDFRGAIDLFTAAYKVSAAPEILFDIGQAYRALGDCRRALDLFNAFVAAAPAGDPLLPKANARRAELAACAATPTSPPTPIEAKPVVVAIAPPPSPRVTAPAPSLRLEARPAPVRGGRRATVCIAAAGSSATLTLVGLGLGLAAWSASRDVQAADAWNDEAQRADARGRAFNDASMLTLATAGVAGLVAATSCWLDWRAARATAVR